MLNITFASFPDFSSNARPLYEYMKKRYKDQMHFLWVVNSEDVKKKLENQNIDVVLTGTKEMEDRMKKTDVFFTSHANLVDYKKQNSNILYIELWHGVSPKNMGNLILDISKEDQLWIDNISKKIDYFIVPSKFWVPIFAARFNMLPSRILPLGFPLFDDIVKSNGKKNLDKLLSIDTSKYKKIIYYMPTSRTFGARKENVKINTTNIFNLKKYDEKKLIDYLNKNNYLLCVKYHPSEETKFNLVDQESIKYINNDMLKVSNLTTEKILNAADILITDYSSLGLHYLMTEKKVIYISYDLKDFSTNRGILFDNFSFWTGKNIATNINEIMSLISENSNNSHEKDMKHLLFGDLKNGNCKEICDYLFENNEISSNVIYTFSNEEELKKDLKIANEKLQAIQKSKSYQIVNNISSFFKRSKK